MSIRAVAIAAVVAGFALGLSAPSFAEEPEAGNPKETVGAPEETGDMDAAGEADEEMKDGEEKTGNPKEMTPE